MIYALVNVNFKRDAGRNSLIGWKEDAAVAAAARKKRARESHDMQNIALDAQVNVEINKKPACTHYCSNCSRI